MAYIFKQSKKWCARIRREGQEVFQPGFETKTDAKEWALAQEALYANGGSGMQGLGPNKTTLAVALRDYAYTVVTTQDGCQQVISKINKYLRAAGLSELHAKKVRGGRVFGRHKDGNIAIEVQAVESTLYELTEVRDPAVLFQGAQQAAFAARAVDNDERNEQPQLVRERLARMPVSKIKSFHLTELMTAMNGVDSHYADATRRQELAILSAFFTNAMNIWNWPLAANPALKVEWPKGDVRERILTTDETARMAQQLKNCTNKGFQVFVLFAMETAMRKGEMLWTACWCDIDRNAEDGDVLKLVTAKAGRREVPLTPFALWLLEQLPRGKDHERIFDLTESAINSAWKRLCDGANIVNFHIHDIRHCAATMYAGLLSGDIFSLQKITGHKTLAMLQRYVNKTARGVAKQLRELATTTIAQTMQQAMRAPKKMEPVPQAELSAQRNDITVVGNIIHVAAFRGRCASSTGMTAGRQA